MTKSDYLLNTKVVVGCRIFICSHCYYGIEIMKLRSNSAAVVWLAWTALPVIGLGRRNVLLVVCFMCMLVLVLRITYGQVVLLLTILNLWLDN
jgi:hypothetical protein